jgi:hypothetical protein
MKTWGHAIEVDYGPDCSWDVIEAAVEWGPHPTACTTDAYNLFRAEKILHTKSWLDSAKLCCGRTSSGSALKILKYPQWRSSHRLDGVDA